MAKKKEKLSKEEKLALVREKIKKIDPNIRLIKASEIETEVAETGITKIDLTIRGFKRGGYSIIWGPDKSGKTTLVLKTISTEQEKGRVCLYASIEERFEPQWAQSLGVNLEELLVLEKGRTLEDTLTALESAINSGMIDTVAIDSVTALLPRQEIEKSSTDTERTIHSDHRGVQARKMSEWFRRTTPIIARDNTCLILVGQGRTEGLNTGMARLGLSGGLAQKYYSSTTLKVWRDNRDAPHVKVGDKKKYTGFMMNILLDKTSLTGNEQAHIRLPFVFGVGLDVGRSDVDAAIADGKIDAQGRGWFKWTDPETEEEHSIHGKEALYKFFGSEEAMNKLERTEVRSEE